MLLLFAALEEGEVVFEDGFGCDWVAVLPHVFLDVVHEIFNAVFVFQLAFDLELLEYFEDYFSLFLH